MAKSSWDGGSEEFVSSVIREAWPCQKVAISDCPEEGWFDGRKTRTMEEIDQILFGGCFPDDDIGMLLATQCILDRYVDVPQTVSFVACSIQIVV